VERFPEKEKYFFYIYDVITSLEKEKRSTLHYLPLPLCVSTRAPDALDRQDNQGMRVTETGAPSSFYPPTHTHMANPRVDAQTLTHSLARTRPPGAGGI
jgi:hypothetical protein